ncbi:MAG: serine hydrolase, partial [Erysipelotrichaceae bacterium]
MKKIIRLIILIFIFTNINIVYGEEVNYPPEEKPDISSDYVYMYDLNTGQVLWDIGSDEVIFPASLTKMMTLIVAIENIDDFNNTVLITEEMLAGLKEARAARAGFDVGDEPLLKDILYGIMLPSGADCTNAAAVYVSGSIEAYVDLMNQKAKELGMNQTHFVNVTGLHNDNHVSSLKDMAKLLEYFLKNETFVEIFSSREHQAITTLNYPEEGLKMESNVFNYINNDDPEAKDNVYIDGFIGGKSGYTTSARYCLASTAIHNDIQYVLITAHSWIE